MTVAFKVSSELERRDFGPRMAEAKVILEQLVMESEGLVIQPPPSSGKKLEPWVLESQMGRLRDKINRLYSEEVVELADTPS